MSSGENREKKLPNSLPRVDRLFSAQYRMMEQATSSRMRLMFFLFSSKCIPTFSYSIKMTVKALYHRLPEYAMQKKKFRTKKTPTFGEVGVWCAVQDSNL